MQTKKKLLITGAGGYTGLHASRYFSYKGWDILCVSRSAGVSCDVTDAGKLETLVSDYCPDYCLHLAAVNSVPVSWTSPQTSIAVNVMGTLHLFEAIRKFAPGCRIVVTGSILEKSLQSEELPPHPYSLSKSFQTLLSRSWTSFYDMDIIVAKPCNLIGPGSSTGICSLLVKKIIDIEQKKAENQLLLNNPNSTREFLDVRDAVSAYEVLFEKGQKGSSYEIGSGITRSLGEVLEELQNHTAIKLNIIPHPLSAVDHFFTQDLKPIKDLGWEPALSFSKSISDVFHYYRTEH
ncbi:NAD-dependent epimerase/dehydratase family protein [Fictibacillus enclensis]|uniref:NAD-dependent epimerase/dehydratase family protein n=1 Tax=Fictibacillus enclensis TaxID=1017270 RepID=UPI0025A16E19|nr:NAD-dependent epimerase/dehydratase family protein [Fictibacillus enclensis]MDM5337857.1 NAD-dependent epimerase/dehydratase family protein [Fictibacillus enclensis]